MSLQGLPIAGKSGFAEQLTELRPVPSLGTQLRLELSGPKSGWSASPASLTRGGVHTVTNPFAACFAASTDLALDTPSPTRCPMIASRLLPG